jgi:DNA polymerase III, alpha subunit
MEAIKEYPIYNLLSEKRKEELKESSQESFVNIHCHSYYSLLDGMTNPLKLVQYTKELKQPAACISDHGVMYSLVDFVKIAKQENQKPLIAMEAYVVRNMLIKGKQESQSEAGQNNREHLLLIAMNETGYKNLMKIASIAATEGFYYRPRIDDEVLRNHNEGLIATSACLGSRFSQLIMKGNLVEARKELKSYAKMFPGRFFLEIQPTKEYQQKIVNHALIKLSRDLGLPLVATSDAHYLKREDSITHDALLSMQSNDTLDNPLRWRFPGDTFFVTSRQEMIDLFEEECEAKIEGELENKPPEKWLLNENDIIFERDIEYTDKKTGKPTVKTIKYVKFKHDIPREIIEEACDNTVVIADMCDFELKFDQTYLPKVNIPENEEFEQWYKIKVKQAEDKGEVIQTKEAYYLRYLCIKGLKKRGKTSKEYRDRLDYELDVIISMGFPDYFLLLEDVVSWCHNNDIPVGPGRGCFVPGQKVKTKDGEKNIEDIKSGDFVLTHRGNYKEVKSVQKYKEENEISVIKFKKLNGEIREVKSTSDHEYFIIPKHYGKDFKNSKWSSANELEKGDLLLIPLPKEEAEKHAHKGHEECLSCFGKKNADWIEEYNRQYHETAVNATRVVEKSLSSLMNKIENEIISSDLNNARNSLEEMRNIFGMNEVVHYEKDMELFSEELLELGYELAYVEEINIKPYNGDVYDLTVEVDTSYTVNGLAVHNSAAGSLVSYAIGITNVDPIQYGLLFERFLNPKRGKLPKQYWALKVNLTKGCVA